MLGAGYKPTLPLDDSYLLGRYLFINNLPDAICRLTTIKEESNYSYSCETRLTFYKGGLKLNYRYT